MNFRHFSSGDLIFKARSRIQSFIAHLYWKLRLKNLGKNSRIFKGFLVIGNPKRITVGNNFNIWHRCIFSVGMGKIDIGNNGLLGVNSYINASEGIVKIGNNVAIAPFCQIYSYSHHYSNDKKSVNSFIINDVTIGDNVFIGAGSILLPGVTIGEGAIIAAGSVVKNDIEKHTINGGIPCKFIKNRYYESSDSLQW